MERRILFRGQKADGEWVTGSLIQDKEVKPDKEFMVSFIAPSLPCASDGGDFWTARMYRVKPETVCQSAGCRDALTEKDIFEGDIFTIDGMPEKGLLVVVFYEGSFAFATPKQYAMLTKGEHPFLNDYARLPELGTFEFAGLLRIKGNVFDNPELLEGGDA